MSNGSVEKWQTGRSAAASSGGMDQQRCIEQRRIGAARRSVRHPKDIPRRAATGLQHLEAHCFEESSATAADAHASPSPKPNSFVGGAKTKTCEALTSTIDLY